MTHLMGDSWFKYRTIPYPGVIVNKCHGGHRVTAAVRSRYESTRRRRRASASEGVHLRI